MNKATEHQTGGHGGAWSWADAELSSHSGPEGLQLGTKTQQYQSYIGLYLQLIQLLKTV